VSYLQRTADRIIGYCLVSDLQLAADRTWDTVSCLIFSVEQIGHGILSPVLSSAYSR
jgi:hypothetical protein